MPPETPSFDPFVVLAAVSSRTSSIKLATGVFILPLRHPVMVARSVITLDRMSGGRVLFGIGVGWMPNEFEIVSIPGTTLIPKDRILSGEALADLPQDKPVVLYCKTGMRSAEALAVLKGAGFSDAVHVGGGVIAWANQIDPSLPTY